MFARWPPVFDLGFVRNYDHRDSSEHKSWLRVCHQPETSIPDLWLQAAPQFFPETPAASSAETSRCLFPSIGFRQQGYIVDDFLLTAIAVDSVEELHHAGRTAHRDRVRPGPLDVFRLFPADGRGGGIMRQHIG